MGRRWTDRWVGKLVLVAFAINLWLNFLMGWYVTKFVVMVNEYATWLSVQKQLRDQIGNQGGL